MAYLSVVYVCPAGRKTELALVVGLEDLESALAKEIKKPAAAKGKKKAKAKADDDEGGCRLFQLRSHSAVCQTRRWPLSQTRQSTEA